MAVEKIHYEIHVKPQKGKWKLFGALESRDDALKQAKELGGGGTSVQVTKETLNSEDGSYHSVSIFREGDASSWKRAANKGKVDTVEALPCFQPQDLYSFVARKTVARVLQDSLARWKLTPLELLHGPEYLERLESSGTVLQAAVQKVAIAQSHSGDGSVAERVRTLHQLVTDAMKIVFIDRDKGRLPRLGEAKFRDLAEKLAGRPRSEFLLNAAMTAELADCDDWDDKLSKCVGWMTDIPQAGDARQLALSGIDGFVSEILSASSAVKDILGEQPDLGTALQLLTKLFCGQLSEQEVVGEGTLLLNARFGAGELPQARMAVAQRLLTELQSKKRLSPQSLDAEMKALKTLGAEITLASDNFLPQEEILEAFRDRSQRLLAPETLEQYLGETGHPPEKAKKLLILCDYLVGDANRRKLASIIVGMIDEGTLTRYFLSDDIPVSRRLQELTELQESVFQSELDGQRVKLITDQLDQICLSIIEATDLLSRVIKGNNDALGKALALLKLASSNILTRGTARERAQTMALKFIRQPEVASEYLDDNPSPESARRIADLRELLRAAGIDPDSVLHRTAA